MYKKILTVLLFGFLIIGAASAADFKINDGFEPISNESYINEDGLYLNIWDYNDEIIREAYLQNDTDYSIVSADNNTYNITYDLSGNLGHVISYVKSGNVTLDHGVMEIAEVDGNKYIFMAYAPEGTADDWELCYEELMKFNENNNIKPLADAI